jgi:hypothetical protein
MIKGSIHQEEITTPNIYAPKQQNPKIHEANIDRIKVQQL